MIENVFTIVHRKVGLEKTPEYWQTADFGVKLNEFKERFKNRYGFYPSCKSKQITREVSFLVKASTTLEQLVALAAKLKKKFHLDCFQISIDRADCMAHMLFGVIKEDGSTVYLNWLAQVKMSVMILCELNLPRPKGIDTWLRYFLMDSFENDHQVFQKQLAALEHGEMDKINLQVMRDVMHYAEAVCKGKLK